MPQSGPPAPAVPQLPVPPAAPGRGLPAAADVPAMQAQLVELRAEHAGLQAQWQSLRGQLQAMTQTNPARPGVAQQWADVASQIAQNERDMAILQARLGQRNVPQTIQMIPGGGRRSGPDPDLVMILGTGVLLAMILPLSIAWARRVWRRTPQVIAPRGDEPSPRFDRLEQAVDAIAIEVERISESQRFLTKLLAERPAAQAASTGQQAGDSSQDPKVLALGAGPAQPVPVAERQAIRDRQTY